MRSNAIHPSGGELDLVEAPRLGTVGLAYPATAPIPSLPRSAPQPDNDRAGAAGNDILFRVRDVVLGLAILIVLSPLLALIAVAIKLDSRGPAIFRQQRGGIGGQSFTCLKFRTMTVQEDGDTVRAAARNDTRITRLGRFLRRTSLDELPQLINVVRGDMSLVGPRPHAIAHDRLYMQAIPDYERRFRVKPGMTGLAQVLDLRGGADTHASITSRLVADLNYVERRSLMLDFVIIVMTPMMLLFCRSAY